MSIIGHLCPTCGAKEGEPCRTPTGRVKKNGATHVIHETRPFSIVFDNNPNLQINNVPLEGS